MGKIWSLFLYLLLCAGISSCSAHPPQVPTNIDTNVIWAIPANFDDGNVFSNGLAQVTDGKHTFFINKQGNNEWNLSFDKVASRYSETQGFRYGIAIVKPEKNSDFCYLYRNGNIMPVQYSDTHWSVVSQEQLSVVENNGKYGYMNLQDLWYIPPQFLGGEPFSNGVSVVWDEKEMVQYFVSSAGTFVETDWKSNMSEIGDGFAVANRSKYVDTNTGHETLPGPYEDCKGFSEGLASVKINGRYGYIDKNGTLIIASKYKCAEKFSSGLAKVQLFDGATHFINSLGEIALSFEKGSTHDVFHEGILAVEQNQRYGFVNAAGDWIVEPKFDQTSWSRHGFYRVFRGGLTGIFNPETSMLVDAQYDNIYPITQDIVVIEKNKKVGLANIITGEIILKPSLEWNGNYGEQLIAVKLTDAEKYGYIDFDGSWVIPPIFEYAGRFSEGLAPVVLDGKTGYIANPIYYPSWTSSELERVNLLGYSFQPEMLQVKVTNETFIKILLEVAGCYKIPTDTILIDTTMPTQEVTRSRAATMIRQMANGLGDNTNFLLSNFVDVTDPDSDIYSDISFAASIGAFDTNMSGEFCPNSTLGYSDAVKSAVRLCEYLLDADYRTNPQRTNLSVSKVW